MNKFLPLSRLIPATAGLLLLGLTAPVLAQEGMQQEESRWTFDGDFRLRGEFNDNAPGTVDRHRQRMRFRFGGTFAVDEEITVGARVTTGNPDDPKSPHVDLGDVLNSFDISIDRLFVLYTPGEVEGLALLGGKFGHPMYRNPVYGELVWDADVQPEGFAAAYRCDGFGPLDSFGIQAATVAVLEQSGSEDAWANWLGIDFSSSTGDDSKFDGGLSYTFFGDLTPGGSGAIAGDLRGNSLTGSEATSDYGILDAVVAYHSGAMVVSGEFINNIRAADTVGDTGVAVGAALKTDAGKFYYQYATIEQDAILTAISQDDMLMATNYDTHMLGWKKNLTKRVGLHVWVMASEPNEILAGMVDEMVYRFRIDLNIDL
ncbi:MAG: putative porin [Planctomycetota bacterium]|jgi:hypothetical protein